MARPKGQPKLGGRQKGTPNKITSDVRLLAQQYGAEALKTLAGIMADEKQPAAARVSASKEILDRAYGKSPQPIEAPGFANANDLLGAIADRLRA